MFFLQKVSLKLRLSLLFCLLFTGMLSGFCTILYSQFSKLQIAEFDTSLYNYAVDVAKSLDVDKFGDVEFDLSFLKLNEKILPFALKNSLISVLDINGNILETRPHLDGNSKKSPFRKVILERVLKNGSNISTIVSNDIPQRVINYLLPVLHKNNPLILQISVPETDYLELNHKLIKFFYISVPVMLLLSLLLGYFFVKQALRPMMEIINKTKSIEVSHLKERVPVPESKDEIWQLANTINLLLARLDETFSAQERFIQDASHQLKTPLTIIKGELDVFNSEIRSELETKNIVESISQEVNFLINLTNNLLILARVDSGAARLSFTPNRLDEIIISQVSRLSKLASVKNISLQINFDSFYKASDEQLTIMCDRDLTGVLFYNLIENAIKYSSDNSVVEITGLHVLDKLLVSVSNEGEGIDFINLEKIFERFYRLQKTATKAKGSGLGLAICRVVAESIGAKIWAEKSATTGSVFYFEIATTDIT